MYTFRPTARVLAAALLADADAEALVPVAIGTEPLLLPLPPVDAGVVAAPPEPVVVVVAEPAEEAGEGRGPPVAKAAHGFEPVRPVAALVAAEERELS
jgi:hypothetical protein